MTKAATQVLNNRTEFLYFLRSRFRLYHKSNVFFRDLTYGVASFLAQRGVRLNAIETESTTLEIIRAMVHEGILREIDVRTWMLDHEEFRKPSTKGPEPEKPAAPAQQAAKLSARPDATGVAPQATATVK